MSTWAERAYRAAEALDMEAIEATDPEDVGYGFRQGAAWQREALLSDETVERVARVLCAAAGENPDSNELWNEEPPWLYYTDEARAALAAALGEDENDE